MTNAFLIVFGQSEPLNHRKHRPLVPRLSLQGIVKGESLPASMGFWGDTGQNVNPVSIKIVNQTAASASNPMHISCLQ